MRTNVKYVDTPIILKEMVLFQRIMLMMDLTALSELLAIRTDLTTTEIENLTTEDLTIVISKVAEAFKQSKVLADLGKQLEGGLLS